MIPCALLRRGRPPADWAELPPDFQLCPAGLTVDDRQVMTAVRAEGDGAAGRKQFIAVSTALAGIGDDRP